MASTKTSVHTTIPRFTVQDGYNVTVMDVLDTGRLAVAGYNDKTKCSFIDLFMLQFDPDSQEKPLLLTPEPYYSEEFTEFGSEWRYVCLLDDRLFLTCCKNTIALYDSSNGILVNQGKFNGRAWCMTTRDGLVYVGLLRSNEVIVFDARELIIKKTITLTGLEVEDWLRYIAVSYNKLFICSYYNRALMCNCEGEIGQEYTNTEYRYAYSITVSEETGLLFILRGGGRNMSRQVVVYSLYGDQSSISGGHSSISGSHSSISGGHILASFKVPDDSRRIRINNNINRLFLVTQGTGEVYEYHTSDIFTFDNLLMRSESLIENDDCQKLLDYFEVPAKNSRDITKSDTPFSSLVHHLREAGKVSFYDINHLMTACSDKGLSKLMTGLNVYQQAQDSKFTKKVLKDQLKALEDKRQELSHKLTESKDENQQFTGRLQITEEERQQLKDTLKATEEERQQLTGRLETTKEERQQLKDTLKATEEERQQLSQRLKTTEEERQQLKDTLKATEDERQQLSQRLKTTEEERRQFKDTLKSTEDERQQYKDALKATEEERQQLTGILKTIDEERHQLKDTLNATEEERKQLKYTLKTTEEERQQLLERLKTTKEERQQSKDTLKATEEERKQLKYTLKTTEEEKQQHVKDGEEDSAASSSNKLVDARLSQSQKRTCHESLTTMMTENPSLSSHQAIRGEAEGNSVGDEAMTKASEEVTIETLQDLSGKFSKEWWDVGRNLKLPETELDNIEADNKSKGQKEVVYHMLLLWKRKHGKKATNKTLRDALIATNRTDLSEYLLIRERCGTTSVEGTAIE